METILIAVFTAVAGILWVAFKSGLARTFVVIAWVAACWLPLGSLTYSVSGTDSMGVLDRGQQEAPAAKAPGKPEPTRSEWGHRLAYWEAWANRHIGLVALGGGAALVAAVCLLVVLNQVAGRMAGDPRKARARRYVKATVYNRGPARTELCVVRYPWVEIGKDRLNLGEAETDPSVPDRYYWPDDTVVDFYVRG